MGVLSNAKTNAGTIGPILRAHTAHLIKVNSEDMSHKDGKLHPSNISRCPTEAVINILLLESSAHDPGLLRIFGLGTAIHEMLQSELMAAGVVATLSNGKPAIEVPLETEDYIGAADGIVHITKDGKAVLEIKSINSMAFAKLTEPKPDHKIQATCYVLALEEELNGSRDILFIYYSKNDSKMKEFKYTVRDVDIQIVRDRIDDINKRLAAFKAKPCAPEPFYDKISSPACRYCSYKRNCHDTFYRSEWDKKLRGETNAPAKSTTKKRPIKKKLGKGRVKEKETRRTGRSLKK